MAMLKMCSPFKQFICANSAPKPIGPYSHAVRVENTLYLSGQIGLDPITSKMVDGGIEAECEQLLKNMGAVLEASGASYADVVKTTVLLSDMSNFDAVNKVYAKFFKSDYPARSAYAVLALPKGANVEIEAVAILKPADTAKI